MEEKDCEHEGLRLDMERMALEPGRMAVILVAMMAGKVNASRKCREKREIPWEPRNKNKRNYDSGERKVVVGAGGAEVGAPAISILRFLP